jgi:acetoacetyl-CoA synthetase
MSSERPISPRTAVEGELLWTPGEVFLARAGLSKFIAWLERERGLRFPDYEALWRWSVTDLTAFWMAIWDCYEVLSDAPPDTVLSGDGSMLGAVWFEGARVNYAEHLLRHERLAAPGKTVFHHSSEIRPLARMSWQELGAKVRVLAASLRRLGVDPGDRVVSYMPNVPETAIAMLATVAIGAVWSAAAPEFGARTVVERFEQIAPKVIFLADGYSFNGKLFDRREDIAVIVKSLATLTTAIWLPYIGLQPDLPTLDVHTFDDLLVGQDPGVDRFAFERVPHDHPLWVLYSSGTTGRPKAIVHSHVGMVVDHLKAMNLNTNQHADGCMFFYTTTGWMMWNAVLSSLIVGSAAVLYDGSPVWGGPDRLWRMASEVGATTFGASPTLVQNMKKAGVRPRDLVDLSRLETVLVGGAPSGPEIFQWFYDEVKTDLWVTSPSGGTELCGSLVGGVPIRPVRAGETQGRVLGIDAHSWSEDGRELVGEVGELVVTAPFPSMPICFWGDVDKSRYRETYFSAYPGVWRHGDLIKFNAHGGCHIYGRSDSTLNRHGVRIGTAEIYRIVNEAPGVVDSLVICCETPDGAYYMPMFVALEPGLELTDELRQGIALSLRQEASPRHVPDEFHQAPGIPFTLTGKKMEVPVRRIVMGVPLEAAASRGAMADPAALDWYVAFAQRPEVRGRRGDTGSAPSHTAMAG